MIMNKKIFTLLVGALMLLSSSFMVNAQRTLPYLDGKTTDKTHFYDILSAETVKKLPGTQGYYYAIGVTGLENPTAGVGLDFYNSLHADSTFVVYVDSVLNRDDIASLRIEQLARLDTAYNFKHEHSYKLGAMRRALWCVNYEHLPNGRAGVEYSNINYTFKNVHVPANLTIPNNAGFNRHGTSVVDLDQNRAYGDTVNILNADQYMEKWFFSHTYLPHQDLMTDMPMYQYYDKEDSVFVLVLETLKGSNDLTQSVLQTQEARNGAAAGVTSGGYSISIKRVHIDDLISNPVTGAVRTSTGPRGEKPVNNVLLFTLKKINTFVMNADDWNSTENEFNAPPSDKVLGRYLNPFTTEDNKRREVDAVEVNDSLYHYGYMNLRFNSRAPSNKTGYLYVDTAVANLGNTQTLAFNWGTRRDNTKATGTITWGSTFRSILGGDHNGKKPTLHGYYGGSPTLVQEELWKRDSVAYIMTYMKDSLMENQSKFRIVYDPFADSTYINVYQSRVRYEYWPEGTTKPSVLPHWWTNSFWVDTLPGSPTIGKIVRPSDLWTNTLYGNTVMSGSGPRTMTEAARDYYDYIILALPSNAEGAKYSDRGTPPLATPIGGGTWVFEKHGRYDRYNTTDGNRGFNFHSGMFANEFTSPQDMDLVMISTADTVTLYRKFNRGSKTPVTSNPDWRSLSHMYGWSITDNDPSDPSDDNLAYKDSLFYVDLQGLGGKTVLSLDQSYENGVKGLGTQIKLIYGERCIEPPKPADPPTPLFDSDLYLIRNERGEYLCVPIWSATDSAHWIIPRANEDPTRMPSYQWVVIYNKATGTFSMTNREFETVSFTNVSLPYTSADHKDSNGNTIKAVPALFNMAGNSFNKYGVYGQATKEAYKQNPVNAGRFLTEMANKVDRDKSFIRLAADVKSDQLLGYKYVDRDSTVVDVYAFKYYNGIQRRYISWNGYEDGSDTLLYVMGTNEYNSLYFALEELTNRFTGDFVTLTPSSHAGYESVYDRYAKKQYNYLSNQTMLFEKFGHGAVNSIGLKPMLRQAYRLLLKDYYKWHPTDKGHYMALGGDDDNYILADRAEATKKYISGSNRVERLFGVPHFYFRNTYFDVDAPGDDYFALLQRLDVGRVVSQSDLDEFEYATGGTYADVEEYLTLRFGSVAAKKILDQFKKSEEHAPFVALVEDNSTIMKMVRRADATVRVSTFQLKRDDDPIYRRFHVNEPANKPFRKDVHANKDFPDTLVFHRVNEEEAGFRLYENSGSYKNAGADPNGGRIYNQLNGQYMEDSLGHKISFLGINVNKQYMKDGKEATNYSIYVDTAFINRGTGWIKPQYMLVVDPLIPVEKKVCLPNQKDSVMVNKEKYVLGRYLYNTAMYAKEVDAANENFNIVQKVKDNTYRNPNGRSYVKNNSGAYSNYERLAFAWAIHKGDKLYVLKGKDLEPLYGKGTKVKDVENVWDRLAHDYGTYGQGDYIDFAALEAYSETGTVIAGVTQYKTVAQLGDKIGLHAIINLGDNTHKDWVFSFRYIERGSSDFVIESETTKRDVAAGAQIRPGYGGWVMFDDEVPVITRTDENEVMAESYNAVFNVRAASEYYSKGNVNQGWEDPVDNDSNPSKFNVIGGTGSVTILNAASKTVVITNALGQVLVNTTINAENASISVPAGVVFVAVDGEAVTKVLVK